MVITRYPQAMKFQEALVEYARFLTILGGRGLFYFFVGSIAAAVALQAISLALSSEAFQTYGEPSSHA